MKLEHKGMRIDLDDDDVRVAVIEALLFGRTLPPPLPFEPPKQAPPERPKPQVPPAVLRCWEALHPVEQQELALLAEAPRSPEEMEKLLGLTQRKLMGTHSRINRLANEYEVALHVLTRGRGREAKHYYLAPSAIPFVKTLAG